MWEITLTHFWKKMMSSFNLPVRISTIVSMLSSIFDLKLHDNSNSYNIFILNILFVYVMEAFIIFYYER